MSTDSTQDALNSAVRVVERQMNKLQELEDQRKEMFTSLMERNAQINELNLVIQTMRAEIDRLNKLNPPSPAKPIFYAKDNV